MLGRTLPDGQRHEVRWEAGRLDDTMDSIRTAAGERWPSLEIHALVQAVVVTDDRLGAAEAMARRTGMAVPDILATPFVCLGTHEEMAAHLLACRERWGTSYFTVRDARRLRPRHAARAGCGSEVLSAGAAGGTPAVRSGNSSRAPARKHTAPTKVPRFVHARLTSWPLGFT